ncbi:hypothetical protein [Glycomyces harbinensis]|uniref:Uncharacterized protein n=1 Tax=Glycomyces harbinensis TaxID=58114 RepID=A0A1G7AMJ9_9ACTN|nr:hypothetical protein [Glycomyces harbinensis]SDE16079.1 hypothetical protein SAMN05216270_11441 [Glycomyces harbinensis]
MPTPSPIVVRGAVTTLEAPWYGDAAAAEIAAALGAAGRTAYTAPVGPATARPRAVLDSSIRPEHSILFLDAGMEVITGYDGGEWAGPEWSLYWGTWSPAGTLATPGTGRWSFLSRRVLTEDRGIGGLDPARTITPILKRLNAFERPPETTEAQRAALADARRLAIRALEASEHGEPGAAD